MWFIFLYVSNFKSVDDANKPIGEENKGNKMLQQMGWKPGTSLGLNTTNKNNLLNPIVAVKRPNRIGLGFHTWTFHLLLYFFKAKK